MWSRDLGLYPTCLEGDAAPTIEHSSKPNNRRSNISYGKVVHQDTSDLNLNTSFNNTISGNKTNQLFDELSDWNHVLQGIDLDEILDKPEP